jgi:hypothetical protein
MAQRAENYWFEKYIDLLRDYMALRQALEIIAGDRQCLDNTMSDKEVAKAALLKDGGNE